MCCCPSNGLWSYAQSFNFGWVRPDSPAEVVSPAEGLSFCLMQVRYRLSPTDKFGFEARAAPLGLGISPTSFLFGAVFGMACFRAFQQGKRFLLLCYANGFVKCRLDFAL